MNGNPQFRCRVYGIADEGKLTAIFRCLLRFRPDSMVHMERIARNPGAAGAIRTACSLGLALIESLALYTRVIIFAKVT